VGTTRFLKVGHPNVTRTLPHGEHCGIPLIPVDRRSDSAGQQLVPGRSAQNRELEFLAAWMKGANWAPRDPLFPPGAPAPGRPGGSHHCGRGRAIAFASFTEVDAAWFSQVGGRSDRWHRPDRVSQHEYLVEPTAHTTKCVRPFQTGQKDALIRRHDTGNGGKKDSRRALELLPNPSPTNMEEASSGVKGRAGGEAYGPRTCENGLEAKGRRDS